MTPRLVHLAPRHAIATCLLVLFLCASLSSQPRILLVNAHPDDESVCAASVYKVVHDLKGTVDLCVITNGEAGFKYSTLAEPYYGLELTDEAVGREHLPRIRKQELLNAARILGIHDVFFLDHRDHRYTTDEQEVLREAWDTTRVHAQLADILHRGRYDYVWCMLPTPGTHGAHKAATILTLQQVQRMTAPRPIVLGVSLARKDTVALRPATLDSFAITLLKPGRAPWTFDRSASFGYNQRLNYKIIVAWLLAEHKSQGTVQLAASEYDLEVFYSFDCNANSSEESVSRLFDDLQVMRYKQRKY